MGWGDVVTIGEIAQDRLRSLGVDVKPIRVSGGGWFIPLWRTSDGKFLPPDHWCSSRETGFEPENGDLRLVATTSAELFGDHQSALTSDEECSGIIPVFDLLGDGWYLTNVQAHTERNKMEPHVVAGLDEEQARTVGRELVEPGQLLAVHIGKKIDGLPTL